MFLLHYPIIVLMSGVVGISAESVGAYGFYLACTLAASALCLHVVDRPVRRWVAALDLKRVASGLLVPEWTLGRRPKG
jgi:peptidoglycan/LPS O-acetylase OafA/YrhL